MIPDSQFAVLCQNTYSLAPTFPVPNTGICARSSFVSGGIAVAFRGSITAEDWLRDFIAAPIKSRDHPQLGRCHAGFLDAAESMIDPVLKAVGDQPLYLIGHSLGGAVAQGVAALCLLAGKKPEAVVTFGSPRFGGSDFVNLLLPIPIRLWHRGNCPVVILPFDVPPLMQFYDARVPLLKCGVAQSDIFLCHNISGYVQDIALLEKQQQQNAANAAAKVGVVT